jgi:hypothetical protein
MDLSIENFIFLKIDGVNRILFGRWAEMSVDSFDECLTVFMGKWCE